MMSDSYCFLVVKIKQTKYKNKKYGPTLIYIMI